MPMLRGFRRSPVELRCACLRVEKRQLFEPSPAVMEEVALRSLTGRERRCILIEHHRDGWLPQFDNSLTEIFGDIRQRSARRAHCYAPRGTGDHRRKHPVVKKE